MSICDSFRQLAFDTWSRLAVARNVQHQPGEEGFTDNIVIELRRRHPTDIFIQPFTKPAEGQTGADWEWWFLARNRSCVGFRVQAKIIELSREIYPHLHYWRNRQTPFQCDTLIQRALSNPHPTFPMYCLYTNWVNFDSRGSQTTFRTVLGQSWPCPSYPNAAESFSCSVASAFSVRALRLNGRKNTLADVFPVMRPWHCLVCCSGFDGSDLPSRVRSYWRDGVQGSDPPDSTDPDPDDPAPIDGDLSELFSIAQQTGVADHPPAHVAAVTSRERAEPPDPDLAGIIAIQEPPE